MLYCIPSNSFTMISALLRLHDSDLLEAIKCTSLPSTVISSFFGIMDVSDFLLSIWISTAFLWFDFHTFNKEITGSQLFCIAYLSSTSPSSQTNLTSPLQLQGLGMGRWQVLTRQDFPAIYNQLTKASRVSSAR